MAIDVQWDADDPTIIRLTMPDKWTWEDYDNALNSVRQMTVSVSHRVDMIADLRANEGYVPHGAMFTHIRRWRDNRPANFGITVNVTTSNMHENILDLYERINQLNNDSLIQAASIDSARQLIAADRTNADNDTHPSAE